MNNYIFFILETKYIMRICIFASEVSALIDKNRYKSREDAYIDIWKRYDNKSYRMCMDHNEYEPPTTVRKRKLVNLENQREVEVQKKIKNLVQPDVSSDQVEAFIMSDPICASLNVTEKNNKVSQLVEILRDESIISVQEKTERCQRVIPTINDTIIKSIGDQRVDPSLPQVIADSSLERFVTDTIHTTIGQQQEDTSINRYEKTNNVVVKDRNKRGYRKYIDGFFIYGKVDGIREDGYIVEHKQRINRLFGRIIEREKIQLYIYMFLTDTTKAILIETYGSNQQSYELDFDESVWNTYKKMLTSAVHDLYDMLRSPDKRNELIMTYNEGGTRAVGSKG